MTGKHLRMRLVVLLVISAGPLLFPSEAQRPARARKDDKIHANLWMQTSAEYRALCLQTFNMALKEVRKRAETAPHRDSQPIGADGKPMAVVADLDETILDNARFQTELALRDNVEYSEALWNRWVEGNSSDVGLLPGAERFIREVEKLNVSMVYISNRPEAKRASTVQALAKNGIGTVELENASDLRLLLKTDSSNKESRRKAIAEKYHVIAFLGDNLGDFPGDFGGAIESRSQRAQEFEELWGTLWFVFPNPIYGDWERALGSRREDVLKRASDRRFIEQQP